MPREPLHQPTADHRTIGHLAHHANVVGGADAEPDANRHLGPTLDTPHQVLHIGRNFLRGTRHARAGNGIDKPVGPLADFIQPRIGGGRRGEEHRRDSARTRCGDPIVGLFGRQIGEDRSRHTRPARTLGERLQPHTQHGVVVAHEHGRHLPAERSHRLQYRNRRHATVERTLGTGLNRGAVGDGIAERNAHLHDVGAPLDQGIDNIGEVRQGRVASGDIKHEGLLAARAKTLEGGFDPTHAYSLTAWPDALRTGLNSRGYTTLATTRLLNSGAFGSPRIKKYSAPRLPDWRKAR